MNETISIAKILEYYAIICLILWPVNLIVLIILYKTTDVLEKLNARIDKFLGVKNKKGTSEEPAKEKEKSTDEKKNPQGDEALVGISSFKINVGETYYCYQPSQSRGGDIYSLLWQTDNYFIGHVDENDMFIGHKAGTVNVYCYRHDNDFDAGTQIYKITVLPKYENPFLDRVVSLIRTREKREKILLDCFDWKVKKNNPANGLLEFEKTKTGPRCIFQFNAKEELERTVIEVKNDRINKLRLMLDERFQPIEHDGKEASLWISKNQNEQYDEVDIYVVLKKTESPAFKNVWVLCIGQIWREYAETEEFLKNLFLAEKMFLDCLPGDVPGKVFVKEESIKRILEQQPKYITGNDTDEPNKNQEQDKTERQKETVQLKQDGSSSVEETPENKKDDTMKEETPSDASKENNNSTTEDEGKEPETAKTRPEDNPETEGQEDSETESSNEKDVAPETEVDFTTEEMIDPQMEYDSFDDVSEEK